MKAVEFEKAKSNATSARLLYGFYDGQIVFTKDGVGTIVKPKWHPSIWSAGDKVWVMLRKNSKRIRLYKPNEVFKLVIVDDNNIERPISPMFYDYLIGSINKMVEYRLNLRNRAILTDDEQERLKKFYLASHNGAYNLIVKLQKENIQL